MPASYIVVQDGYSGTPLVVYGPTSDKAAADKVAQQHAARKVIERKDGK